MDPISLALFAAKGVGVALKVSKIVKSNNRNESHALTIWEALRIPGARILALNLIDRSEARGMIHWVKVYSKEVQTRYEKYVLLNEGQGALWRVLERQSAEFQLEAISGALFLLLVLGNASVEKEAFSSWKANELPYYLSHVSGKSVNDFLGHTDKDQRAFADVIDPIWRGTGKWRSGDDHRQWARNFKNGQSVIFRGGPHPGLWPDASNKTASSWASHQAALPAVKYHLPNLKIKDTETKPFQSGMDYHLLTPGQDSTWAACMFVTNALRALTFDSWKEDQVVIFQHPFDHAFAKWLQKPLGLKILLATQIDKLEETAGSYHWTYIKNWLFVFPPANKTDITDQTTTATNQAAQPYWPVRQQNLARQTFVIVKNFKPAANRSWVKDPLGDIVHLSDCKMLEPDAFASGIWFSAFLTTKSEYFYFPLLNLLPCHDPNTLDKRSFINKANELLIATQDSSVDKRPRVHPCKAGTFMVALRCQDEEWWVHETTGNRLSWNCVAVVDVQEKRWGPWIKAALEYSFTLQATHWKSVEDALK